MEGTASHYDVLGVRRDASHDAVKAAFTERALRYHPDRQPPENRAEAEWRMREVNQAWAVLRNPATRAAYDAELAAADPRSGRRPVVPTAPMGPTLEPVDAEPPPRPSRLRQLAPLIVGGLLLGAFLVFTAYAADPGEKPAVDVEVQDRFAAGSCVRVGGSVVEVPCNQPSSGRVVTTVDFPRPCPNGTRAVIIPSEKLGLCLTP